MPAAKVSSVQEYYDTLESRFVADASDGVDMVFQYEIPGAFDFYVTIKNKTMTKAMGKHASPTCTMTIAQEHYLKVVNGEMKGPMAFLTGKMKIGGNKMLAQKVQKILPIAGQ